MTLESMDRVEQFVAEVGATFWIEHDLALFEGLDKAPAYYESRQPPMLAGGPARV